MKNCKKITIKNILLVFCFFATLNLGAVDIGTKTQSFILEAVPRVKLIESEKISPENSNIKVQYVNGFGEVMQTVLVRNAPSPTFEDLVFARRQKVGAVDPTLEEFLPTPIANNNGSYMNPKEVLSKSQGFYGESRTYTETQSSDIGEVVRIKHPGDAWALAGRLDKFDNVPLMLVKEFKLQITSSYRYSVKCSPSYLEHGFFKKHTDEDNRLAFTFTDSFDRLRLTRSNDTSDNPHDTYYIYDNFNRLCMVLPPLAADAIGLGATITEDDIRIKNYAYIYKYDKYGRCIKKRLPGCDWIYYVYDKGDRLVLTQDGEQRKDNQWTFNKYDILGRVIITGTIEDKKSHASIINEYGQQYSVERFGAPGDGKTQWYSYPNTSKPKLGHSDIRIVNFYDDLQRVSIDQSSLSYKQKNGYDTNYSNVKGLLVGTIEHIEGIPSVEKVARKYFYDDKNRNIQIQTFSHLGTINTEYIAYNFTGQPIKKLVEHGLPKDYSIQISSGTGFPKGTYNTQLDELFEYEYDHAGRLLEIRRNGEAIQTNSYDALGRLKNRKQGSIPIVDMSYVYNIRSWITGLDEKQGQFTQNLEYHGGVTPSYTGNITKMITEYISGSFSQTYSSSMVYDKLNRLEQTSTYGVQKLLSNSKEYPYNYVESMYYDKHGNINSIYRETKNKSTDFLTFVYKGNQISSITSEYPNSSGTSYIEYPGDYISKFTYNSNGSQTSEEGRGIVAVRYNYLNLPTTIQFKNGNQISYTYSPSGQKLRVEHIVAKQLINQPIVGQILQLPFDSIKSILTTDYVGSYIYENKKIKMVNFEGGYVNMEPYRQNFVATNHYNIYDYIGNIRLVKNERGGGVSITDYHSFGTPYQKNSERYKYSGKEFDQMHDLNWYDFHARQYDPLLARFTSMDPLAEKYYSISPYAYCVNNPLKFIDPDGREIKTYNYTHYNKSGRLSGTKGLSSKTGAAMRAYLGTKEGF